MRPIVVVVRGLHQVLLSSNGDQQKCQCLAGRAVPIYKNRQKWIAGVQSTGIHSHSSCATTTRRRPQKNRYSANGSVCRAPTWVHLVSQAGVSPFSHCLHAPCSTPCTPSGIDIEFPTLCTPRRSRWGLTSRGRGPRNSLAQQLATTLASHSATFETAIESPAPHWEQAPQQSAPGSSTASLGSIHVEHLDGLGMCFHLVCHLQHFEPRSIMRIAHWHLCIK